MNENPTENGPESSTSSAATQEPSVPVLRREAVYVVSDPRKFAGVAAVTALAGVAIGFALALLAQPMHHCPAVRVESAQVAPSVGGDEWRMTWLGVEITTARESGATVLDVLDGTPAQSAGLVEGDRIVAIDGDVIHSAPQLVRAIRARESGSPVTVRLMRDGEERRVRATLTSISPRSSHLW